MSRLGLETLTSRSPLGLGIIRLIYNPANFSLLTYISAGEDVAISTTPDLVKFYASRHCTAL